MERFANFVLKLALNNHCKGLTTFRGGDTKGGGDEGLAVVVLRAEAISGIGGGGVVLVLVVLATVESARSGQVGSGCRA